MLHNPFSSQALGKVTTLSYEFYRDEAGAAADGQAGKVSIVVPHLDRVQESDHAILGQLVERFNVPQQFRWGLRQHIGAVVDGQCPTSCALCCDTGTGKALHGMQLSQTFTPVMHDTWHHTSRWQLLCGMLLLAAHACYTYVLLLCRFPLLSAIHRAHSFGAVAGRRHIVSCRLMALIIASQSSPAPGAWAATDLHTAFGGIVGECLWGRK